MTIRKPLSFALAALILAVAARDSAARQEKDKKDDKGQLQGTGVVVSAEETGMPQGELDKARFTFKDDHLTIRLKDEKDATELTFKLSPDKAPKQIDIVPANEKSAVGEGIYELAGET